jgi:hypothetical protein
MKQNNDSMTLNNKSLTTQLGHSVQNKKATTILFYMCVIMYI